MIRLFWLAFGFSLFTSTIAIAGDSERRVDLLAERKLAQEKLAQEWQD